MKNHGMPNNSRSNSGGKGYANGTQHRQQLQEKTAEKEFEILRMLLDKLLVGEDTSLKSL